MRLKIDMKGHYFIAFAVSLAVAVGLLVSGFCLPPKGQIDPSALTAAGLLWLWPTLALFAKSLDEGRTARLTKGDLSISVDEKPRREVTATTRSKGDAK